MLARAKDRLTRLRNVAAMSHNPEIVAAVSKIADELEADIAEVEAESGPTIIHLEPPVGNAD